MPADAPPAPPRVVRIEAFWTDPPPAPSPRCSWWLSRIDSGWRPSGRVASFGYYEAAEYFGVWIWEWLFVLSPALDAARAALGIAAPSPEPAKGGRV